MKKSLKCCKINDLTSMYFSIVIQAMFLFTGVGGYYGALGLGLVSCWRVPAKTALTIFWQGELTNPLQVFFLAAKDFGYRETYLFLTPIFTYMFLFVRLLVIPPVSLYSVYRASYTREVSFALLLSLCVCIMSYDCNTFVCCFAVLSCVGVLVWLRYVCTRCRIVGVVLSAVERISEATEQRSAAEQAMKTAKLQSVHCRTEVTFACNSANTASSAFFEGLHEQQINENARNFHCSPFN